MLLSATLCVLVISLPLFSQGNFGTILGTITDQTGGVMAGATITVTDTQRNTSRNLTTNDAGEYVAATLLPGTYTVRAEDKGFKTVERQNIVLEVGREIRVDLSLQPGEQTQTLTVTEQVPQVDTTSATLGGTVDNQAINDLPLNGRNYQNLVSLRPGVMIQPGGGPWTQSTNGVRPDEVAWMVDGVLNANFFDSRPVANMPSPFTDGATILPIDAIQEFNLEEDPKAEFGWKPGAVVNVGIKSGTNNLHGTAYAFGRSDAFDARNYFNPAAVNGNCPLASCAKLPAQLKQFGGTVGGPVIKDKLFFFAGYEGLRSLIGNALGATIPETGLQSPADPAHSLADALSADLAAGVAISPVSLKLVGCTTAPVSCTGGLFSGAQPNSTSFLSSFPNQNTSDNGVAKLDYHINDKQTINGVFFLGNYNSFGEDHPFVNQLFTDNSPIRTYSNVENWIWTPSSTLVNEFRFGYNRVDFAFNNNDANLLANGTGYPLNTGITSVGGLPNIYLQGFGGTYLGTNPNRPQNSTSNPVFDFQDSITYLKGKHALKFGAEISHIEADSDVGVLARGAIHFNGGATNNPSFLCPPPNPTAASCSTSLEDFFAGNPTFGQDLVGNPALKVRWMYYGAYIQDDWRVKPRLTINAGLRYEYQSPMKEVNGNFGSFNPTTGMVQQGQNGLNTLWNPDRANFSPRLGFAWDITGKGTTVVRGGAGLIYSSFALFTFTAEFDFQNSNATSIGAVPTGALLETGNCAASGTCPKGSGTITLGNPTIPGTSLNWNSVVFPTGSFACGDGIGADASPCNIMGVNQNLHTPYVTNWNLDIQHAFTPNLSLDLGYVGNHGGNLLSWQDINQAPAGAGYCLNALAPAQIAGACAGGPLPLGSGAIPLAEQEARPFYSKFPYLGYINFASNGAWSNFDSLQATLTQRVSHGLSFIGGYTYAHALDNGSLNRFGLLPQNSQFPQLEYANSDFDLRHRFTLTTTYNIPGKKGYGQMLEGWQVNSIVTVQSSQPWQVNDFSDNFSGTGDFSDRWDFFGNPSDFSSGTNSIPFCNHFGTTATGGIDASTATCSVTSLWGTVALPSSLAQQCASKAPSAVTLAASGCYVSGSSVLVPPALGTFGTMGRNIFRDSAFRNWDLSIFKNFTFRERFGAQFRVEFFNVLNHPNIANPYGASNGYLTGNDPSSSGNFGFSGATPDAAAGNPLVGSGSARVMQLGLKLTF